MSQRQSVKYTMVPKKTIKKRTPISINRTISTPVATTRMVKKIISNSTETKYVDGSISLTPGNTGSLGTLVLPAQGASDTQRTGDDIKVQSLQFRGYVLNGNVHVMRIIVFQWHIESTTAPTYGNILNGTWSGTSTQAPFGFPAWDYVKTMFTILSDRTIYAGGNSSDIGLVNYMVNIPGSKIRKIHFINGSTTDCFNGLYVLTVQDGVASLNTLDANYRLQYKDA